MADTFDLKASTDMLRAVSRSVIDQTDVLTAADLAIGDGDHGIGMRRGFEGALESLDDTARVHRECAQGGRHRDPVEDGGAAGAIFGTLFRAGSSRWPAATGWMAKVLRPSWKPGLRPS